MTVLEVGGSKKINVKEKEEENYVVDDYSKRKEK